MYTQTALTSVDSYKLGHAEQYPKGTTKVYSNFTARSSKHLSHAIGKEVKGIVWFGLQSFLLELNDMWDKTFFSRNKEDVVSEFESMVAPFCGPNGFDTKRIAELHNLGYLPLEIKAISEGSVVNIGVPVLTITNTRPQEFWLPNFLETWMSSELWKASTSATISYEYRKIINKYANTTGGSTDFIDWQGHDFSVRGMSGINDAAKSGAGHLLSFTGSDNIPAVKLLLDCYNGKATFIAGSVPATEHSVMCAGGKDSEVETFQRLLKTYPSGIVSIVSDTWDFWNVITNTANTLKDEILSRKKDAFGNSKVVFRPDSGDPVKILCGDENAPEGSPEYKGAVECLAEIFGSTINAKGFKTLNSKVGLIYGDSITIQRCEEILKRLSEKGYASDNVVFGIGSYTFQYNTRDTLGFAMKATYVEIEGEGVSIFKDPKTDDGTKKSAKGLLTVQGISADYKLLDDVSKNQEATGCLQTVYKNGAITRVQSLEEIRNRLGAKFA